MQRHVFLTGGRATGWSRGPEGLCGVGSKLEEPNHNWLRVGRVIRSLKLLGCEQSAVELFDFVRHCRVYRNHFDLIF